MSPRRVGVIAIGSNSTRMLTANLDASLSDSQRGREETALFLSMDEKRKFSEQGMERCARAVSKLHYEAKQAGAEQVRLIATSAVRDAANRHELDFIIAAIAPMMLTRIITGEEEAQLSFMGATCVPRRSGLQGMIDIGGGSTEVALGDAEQGLSFAHSLQLGASRLLKWQAVNSKEDLAAARLIATDIIDQSLPQLPEKPKEWVLVGGTGTTTVNMVLKQPYDKPCPEEEYLSLDDVNSWLDALCALSPQQRSRLPGLPPSRVHILPTGLTILSSVMERLNIDRIRVTRRNNLDGYLYRQYCCPQEDPDA